MRCGSAIPNLNANTSAKHFLFINSICVFKCSSVLSHLGSRKMTRINRTAHQVGAGSFSGLPPSISGRVWEQLFFTKYLLAKDSPFVRAPAACNIPAVLHYLFSVLTLLFVFVDVVRHKQFSLPCDNVVNERLEASQLGLVIIEILCIQIS